MVVRSINEPLIVGIAKKAIHHPALLYTGPRKMLQDITFQIPRVPELQYHQLGYGGNKQKQLIRTYWNEDEAQRVREVLARRGDQAFTSVAMSLRNQAKDSRSMGWCMNSLVVTRMSRERFESVEIQYRSSELTLKFGGDLCFVPWMFDELNLNPSIIRFRFSNAYFSGVYFAYLSSFWPNGPVAFLDYLWRNDPKLFGHGTGHFFRSSFSKDQEFKYSPENLAHRFGWKHLPMKEVYRYCKQRYKELGKSMPNRTMKTEQPDEEE